MGEGDILETVQRVDYRKISIISCREFLNRNKLWRDCRETVE